MATKGCISLLRYGFQCNTLWKNRYFPSVFSVRHRIGSFGVESYSFNCNKRTFFTVIPKLPFEIETVGAPNFKLVMDWVKQEEAEEVIEFLLECFLTSPPLRQIHRFDESAETRRPLWYMNMIRQYVSQPYSLIVRDQSYSGGNKIVAACVNYLELKPNLHHHEEPLTDQSVGWIRRALGAELNRGVDLFARYRTDKILKLGSGSIRADLGKMGLVTLMCKLAMNRAYRDGAGAVKAEAFSKFGHRVNFKLGFEIIQTVDYDKFEYPTGVKPLGHLTDILHDHRCCRLFSRTLP